MEHFPDLRAWRARILEMLEERATPLFLLDSAILTDRAVVMQDELRNQWGPSAIAYAFKANYQVAELQLLRELGLWAEVVSGREYAAARRLGYEGPQIVFNGPHKTDSELRRALVDGALLHVYGPEELERLTKVATSLGGTFEMGIRVNARLPGLEPSRFGFSIDSGEADAAARRIRDCPALELTALQFHCLGDTVDPHCYRVASRKLATFAKQSIPNYGHALRSLDLGGGFPAHGPKPRNRDSDSWNPRPIGEYVEPIVEELEPAFPQAARPTLILEPGRYLVNDAIVLISHVIDVPQGRSEARQTVLSNASITMVPLTHYSPQIIRAWSPELEPRGGEEVESVLYGASCREDDVLQEGPFPRVRVGDFLVYYAVGAYNANLGPDFIFESPPLAVL